MFASTSLTGAAHLPRGMVAICALGATLLLAGCGNTTADTGSTPAAGSTDTAAEDDTGAASTGILIVGFDQSLPAVRLCGR